DLDCLMPKPYLNPSSRSTVGMFLAMGSTMPFYSSRLNVGTEKEELGECFQGSSMSKAWSDPLARFMRKGNCGVFGNQNLSICQTASSRCRAFALSAGSPSAYLRMFGLLPIRTGLAA